MLHGSIVSAQTIYICSYLKLSKYKLSKYVTKMNTNMNIYNLLNGKTNALELTTNGVILVEF